MGYIIIPDGVMALEGVSVTHKFMLSLLAALMGQKGYCFATDTALADMIGVTNRRTVQNYLLALESGGFIRREQDGRGARRIYPTDKMRSLFFSHGTKGNSGAGEEAFTRAENKVSYAGEKNVSHNNIYNNKNNSISIYTDKASGGAGNSAEKRDVTFSDMFNRAVGSITPNDEMYSILKKHKKTIYDRCERKYNSRKYDVANKYGYIRALIINTCREDFENVAEFEKDETDFSSVEAKMWARI